MSNFRTFERQSDWAPPKFTISSPTSMVRKRNDMIVDIHPGSKDTPDTEDHEFDLPARVADQVTKSSLEIHQHYDGLGQ